MQAADGRRGGSWADLPTGAKVFRLVHAGWGIVNLASLGSVWVSAIRRRRGRPLAVSVAFLTVEGLALVAGRGDCPFGPLQARLGDPIPMFELVLPPRAAKAAIPALTVVTLMGFLAVAVRGPSRPPGQSQPVGRSR